MVLQHWLGRWRFASADDRPQGRRRGPISANERPHTLPFSVLPRPRGTTGPCIAEGALTPSSCSHSGVLWRCAGPHPRADESCPAWGSRVLGMLAGTIMSESKTRTILAGVNESEHSADAIALATALAPCLDADAVAAYVYPPGDLEPATGEGTDEPVLTELADSVLAALGELGSTIDARHLTLMADRSAARGLQRAAEEGRALVISLGSTRRSTLGRDRRRSNPVSVAGPPLSPRRSWTTRLRRGASSRGSSGKGDPLRFRAGRLGQISWGLLRRRDRFLDRCRRRLGSRAWRVGAPNLYRRRLFRRRPGGDGARAQLTRWRGQKAHLSARIPGNRA